MISSTILLEDHYYLAKKSAFHFRGYICRAMRDIGQKGDDNFILSYLKRINHKNNYIYEQISNKSFYWSLLKNSNFTLTEIKFLIFLLYDFRLKYLFPLKHP